MLRSTNPIKFFGLRGTSFDGPEVDADGNPTSALGQIQRINPFTTVLDLVQTGSTLNWLVSETNSEAAPVKPAEYSDADWEELLRRFTGWEQYSVAIADAPPALRWLGPEAQRLETAVKDGFLVKVYDAALAVLFKG